MAATTTTVFSAHTVFDMTKMAHKGNLFDPLKINARNHTITIIDVDDTERSANLDQVNMLLAFFLKYPTPGKAFDMLAAGLDDGSKTRAAMESSTASATPPLSSFRGKQIDKPTDEEQSLEQSLESELAGGAAGAA